MEFERAFQEKIEWERYPKAKWYDLKEDGVMLDKFPTEEIVALERRQKKTKRQKWLDWLCCLCTDAPDSGAELVNTLEDISLYYLVKKEGKYLLVHVGKEDITAWEIPPALAEQKKIPFGKNDFYKTKRRIKSYGTKE